MNIIVTGGAGFIGSNFVYLELEKHPEDRIICLDKLTYAGNLATLEEAMKNPNFRFVKGDIADKECVEKLFEEEHPDIIVNFAAESHVDRSIEDPGIFLKTNIFCKLIGTTRFARTTGDAFELIDNLFDGHALYKRCNTLGIAIAATLKCHIGNLAIFNVEIDSLRTSATSNKCRHENTSFPKESPLPHFRVRGLLYLLINIIPPLAQG